MLADSYVPIYLIWGLRAAVVSLVVAIGVETPILRRLWRRSWVSTFGWVMLANAVSAAFGVFPPMSRWAMAGIGVDADPLEVCHLYWRNHLTTAGVLFSVTICVELAVYLLLKMVRPVTPATIRRIVLGTLISNLASYTLLVGYVLARRDPPVSPGITLLADTKWVNVAGPRVWFIDPDAHQLCSIGLDGTDRRTEVRRELPGEWGFLTEPVGAYTIVPSAGAILYTGRGFRWWLQQHGTERDLGIDTPENLRGYPAQCDEIVSNVWQALTAAKLAPSTQPISENRGPAFFSSHPLGFQWEATADGRDFHVRARYLPDGSMLGNALEVENTSSGTTISFWVSNGLTRLACLEPIILDEERLVLFRCGSWLMVMDPQKRTVGRLVRGVNMLVETAEFQLAELPKR